MSRKMSADKHKGTSKRRLTTVVATDICGYSSLSEQNDQLAIRTVDTIYTLFEKSVDQHDGRVFKRVADGFLAEFPNAESALRAAMDFTNAVKDPNNISSDIPEETAVRTGVHVGDVTERDDGDLLGHGVNVAVRLQENAQRNGILASQNIIDVLGSNFPYHKIRRGMISLKNISQAILAFDIVDRPSTYLQSLVRKAKTTFRKPVRSGAFPLFALFLFLIGNSTVKSNILEKRLLKVKSEVVDDQGISPYYNQLEASYVYRVLFALAESKQSSDQAVFALIETGDIDGAVTSLEKKLEKLDEESPAYLSTLHQIGALSFHRNPSKAIETYAKVIEIDSSDVSARRRLARSYGGVGAVCKAKEQYDSAIKLKGIDHEQSLRIEIDRAFNLYLLGKSELALETMAKYENEMEQRPPDYTWSQFYTNQGIYLQASGNNIKSEALLTSINARQKTLGDEVNLSRAFNVLGGINLQRARENTELKKLYLSSARDQFRNQLRLDKKLNRVHALPELHYYLGETFYEMEMLEDAAAQYSIGKRLADENHIVNFQFLNRLGLALIEQRNGKQSDSCLLAKEMQQIYDSEIKTGIGPNTQRKIKSMSCDFVYKPQPSSSECN